MIFAGRAHDDRHRLGPVLAEGTTYEELGPDYFERRTDAEARQRQLVRQLEALGHKVTLEPAA